jgi:hypothetical protein
MKKVRNFFIFLIILAVVLFISNPDKKDHQEKIVEKYKEENPLTGALGAGDMVKQVIAYKNYHICSVGKISVTDESVSIGIAGFVYVYGSLDLMKYKDMVPK